MEQRTILLNGKPFTDCVQFTQDFLGIRALDGLPGKPLTSLGVSPRFARSADRVGVFYIHSGDIVHDMPGGHKSKIVNGAMVWLQFGLEWGL
jgi:hypothetical protein